jgi:hypothetical protein
MTDERVKHFISLFIFYYSLLYAELYIWNFRKGYVISDSTAYFMISNMQ